MKKYALSVVAVVLVVLYALSFFPSKRNGRKQPSVETVFLNKKYASSVAEIEIKKNNSRLRISKNAEIWIGAFFESTEDLRTLAYFPVDRTVVARIIGNLQKPVTLYKTAEKRSDGSYGLAEENAVIISYRTEEGVCAEITVGDMDFSRSFRYIAVSDAQAVYRTSFDFAELLHAEPNFWYDPYIVPRSLLASSYTDIQKIKIISQTVRRTHIPSGTDSDLHLLELRHGAVCAEIPGGEPAMTLEFEFGNAEFLTLSFYHCAAKENSAGEYSILYHHASLDYAFFISGWTFSRICEALGISEDF